MLDHDCREHARYRQSEWIEEHGEACRDEWWECAICGEKLTGDGKETPCPK